MYRLLQWTDLMLKKVKVNNDWLTCTFNVLLSQQTCIVHIHVGCMYMYMYIHIHVSVLCMYMYIVMYVYQSYRCTCTMYVLCVVCCVVLLCIIVWCVCRATGGRH